MQMTTVEKMPMVEPVKACPEVCPLCGWSGARRFLQAPDRYHGRTDAYELVRCPVCSLVWLANPPAPETMGDHYGDDYDNSVATAGDDPERWSGRVKVISDRKSGGALLDLGCSAGGFLRAIRKPSWKLYGIEMSQTVANRAEAASGATVFVGDILDAPFPASSFDAITCFHVLEHVYQPLAVLRKIACWLKPGGILYLMVPNIDSAGARIFGAYWYALELPRHLYHYSPRSLGVMADAVGLEQISVTTHRELFVEDSVGYLLDGLLPRIGISRLPKALREPPGLPFRAIRKIFRLTAIPVLNGMAGLLGDGESIHGVFHRPAQ